MIRCGTAFETLRGVVNLYCSIKIMAIGAGRIVALVVCVMVAVGQSLHGQEYLNNPKYGSSERVREECAVNISLYSEYYRLKNYSEAYRAWKKVFTACPAASKNTYIRGAKILKYMIDQAPNVEARGNLLDTLMLLYDRRIEIFGETAYVLGLKASDLFTIDAQRYEEAYVYSQRGISLAKGISAPTDLYTYMALTSCMYKNNKITADVAVESYMEVGNYLDSQLLASPNDEDIERVRRSVDAQLVQMGAINCAGIVGIFAPRFDTNKSDVGLCKRIRSLMLASQCSSEPLLLDASIALFNAEPSAALACDIAHLYHQTQNYLAMERYYHEAIKLAHDSVNRASYYYQLALLTFAEFKKPEQARNIALSAIRCNPSMGEAYKLLGDMYASERSCGGSDLEKKAVYWAATDKYAKAKEIDPKLTEAMNALISTYSQYFPSREDIFFHGLEPGNTYTVGCWINETTTIRQCN